MNDAIRSLRSEARQLARGKLPKAIRYPVAFREAAATVARTQLDRGGPDLLLKPPVGRR